MLEERIRSAVDSLQSVQADVPPLETLHARRRRNRLRRGAAAAAVIVALAVALPALFLAGNDQTKVRVIAPPTTAEPASPTTAANSPTTTPTSAAPPTTIKSSVTEICDPRHLAVSAVQGSGAGGHLAVVVTFTNRSTLACSMEGYPAAWLIESSGVQVGPSTDERGGPQTALVVLQPGGKASTTVWYDNPSVPYPPCTTTTVNAIRVIPPGQSASLTAPTAFPVCRPPGPTIGATAVIPGTSESIF